MPRKLPELSLGIQFRCKDAMLPTRSLVRRYVRASCDRPAEVAIRFVDAEEGRALNRDYRHKDSATNVLSFVYESEPSVAGDLVVCVPVVLREAAEQDKTPEAHFAHLIVHGMLHLMGYDHETGKRDAARMEAREREILTALGYADPYA
ncbi:MAG: rRNA maturation RNase YbeY [Rhodocyclaceae bacterium]|jgi:probable rRNA maturation factor|nr:rRNA maturation RNase YbeY [Rhodocyclaceae bacterium]MBK6554212.1 rRNA maturation RNase YbeY [Rhodocyclaceae bacterium]MBK6677831.1 rRNA maturation RNase YbeY [Rhodocyclaceae bacterium]MBK9310505.1 rRNA maturation RNase YbeY [Rhodocyclaceae bacterium]MBK9954423.1 rRNA maturation RNase YbeY [Rhodocyclaceae bacterium]